MAPLLQALLEVPDPSHSAGKSGTGRPCPVADPVLRVRGGKAWEVGKGKDSFVSIIFKGLCHGLGTFLFVFLPCSVVEIFLYSQNVMRQYHQS